MGLGCIKQQSAGVAQIHRHFTHLTAAAGQYWETDNFSSDVPASEPFKIEVVCQPFFNAISTTQWIVSTSGAGGSHNPSIQCGSNNRVGYGMRWSDGTPITKGNAFIVPAEYRSELITLTLEWDGSVFIFKINDGDIGQIVEPPPTPGLTPQRDLRGLGIGYYLTGNSHFFDGIIDEVKLYQGDALKCHYKFDQENAEVVYDLVTGLQATGYNFTQANTDRFVYEAPYWVGEELFNPDASHFSAMSGVTRLDTDTWNHFSPSAVHETEVRLSGRNVPGSTFLVSGEATEGVYNLFAGITNHGLNRVVAEYPSAPYKADKVLFSSNTGGNVGVCARQNSNGEWAAITKKNSLRRVVLGAQPKAVSRFIYSFSAAAGQYMEVPELKFNHGDYFEIEFKGQIEAGGATLVCSFGNITNRLSFWTQNLWTSQTIRNFNNAEWQELSNGDIQSLRFFVNRELAWNVGRRNRISLGADRTSGAAAFSTMNRIGSPSNNSTSVPGWTGLLFDIKVRINGELVRHYPMDDDPASPIFRELVSGAHGQKVNFNGTEAQLFSVTGNKAINMTTQQEIIIR